MEFFEAPAFARYVYKYMDDDAYRELQTRLAAAPEFGDVIQGTGGFRKLRWTDPRRRKEANGDEKEKDLWRNDGRH